MNGTRQKVAGSTVLILCVLVLAGAAAHAAQMIDCHDLALPVSAVFMPTADFDGDGDVDQSDFVLFKACLTGPTLGPPATGCSAADLDGDGDVDQSDFGIFQRCYSGEDNQADPNCGN